jgi:His/Glu/Gln/Arg/opine family amino acid ABC transporter permease subunit
MVRPVDDSGLRRHRLGRRDRCRPEGHGCRCLVTLPIGLLIGFLVALGQQSEEKAMRLAAGIYTTIFRGLPELLTLFIIYYGMQILIQSVLAWIGYDGTVEINAFFSGVIALSVVFSAYCSEVLLSAFRAIPKGQYEAGDALGLHRGRTMLLIILPQLVRIALPGIVNLWMILLKDTSYVSIIGLADVLRQTGVAVKVTKEAFLFYTLACGIYLGLADHFLLRPALYRTLGQALGDPPMSHAEALIPAQPAPKDLGKPVTFARVTGSIIVGVWIVLAVALVAMIISGWDIEKFTRYGPRYLHGLMTTITLVAISVVCGAVLSLPLAFARMSKNKVINAALPTATSTSSAARRFWRSCS